MKIRDGPKFCDIIKMSAYFLMPTFDNAHA